MKYTEVLLVSLTINLYFQESTLVMAQNPSIPIAANAFSGSKKGLGI